MQGTVSETSFFRCCVSCIFFCLTGIEGRSVECNADSILAFSLVFGRAGQAWRLLRSFSHSLVIRLHGWHVSLPSPIPRDVFPWIDFSPRLNPASRVSQLVTQWFTVIHSASKEEDLEENIRRSIAFAQILPGKSRITRNQLTAKCK